MWIILERKDDIMEVMSKHKAELAIFVLIIGIAAVLRLCSLSSVPLGIAPGEATNGVAALRALEAGDIRVLYPQTSDRGLFIAFQTLAIRIFDNTPFALRVVPALAGILTVVGLYLLAKQLFSRHTAAIASALLATSFWHVFFSRLGIQDVFAALFLVWGVHFFWQGLSSARTGYFMLSGIFWGLGFYTHNSFFVLPLIVIAVLLAYRQSVERDFGHSRYVATRAYIARGLGLMAVAALIAAFPLVFHYSIGSGAFFSNLDGLAPGPALKHFAQSVNMLLFMRDFDWGYNFSGYTLLFWPLAPFFAIGLVGGILKLMRIKKKHGHFSTVQVLIFSWLLIGMLPSIFSTNPPSAGSLLLVAPVVFLITAEGIWWLFQTLERWYHAYDLHELNVSLPMHHRLRLQESRLVSIVVLVIFLGAIGFSDYYRYFTGWAHNPQTTAAFHPEYVDLAERINKLPTTTPKYILIRDLNSPAARTVMYLTNTATEGAQSDANVSYLTKEEYRRRAHPRGSVMIPLEN